VTISGVKCEDKCKEIGAEWKKKTAEKEKARSAAIKIRQELVDEAARLRKEVEDRISSLKTMLQSDEVKIRDAEAALVEAEKQEKLRVVKAPKEGGKLGMLVSLAKARTEALREGMLKLMQQKEDAEFRVRELEGILERFKTDYNPNFNDEGVKRAVREWEDYESRGRHPEQDSVEAEKTADLIQDDSEHGINWSDYEKDDSDTEARKSRRYNTQHN